MVHEVLNGLIKNLIKLYSNFSGSFITRNRERYLILPKQQQQQENGVFSLFFILKIFVT